MYSRNRDPKETQLQIPEHYSGCTFAPRRQEEPVQDILPLGRHPTVARPTPPPAADHTEQNPPPRPREEERESAPKERALPVHSTPRAPLFDGLGKGFPFAHGIGSEELLLLGLILLLARQGQDSDMLLWLALLLFCN